MSKSLRGISDNQLLARFRDLGRRDCALEAELLAHLAEIERRNLHAREGYSSLFHYCIATLNCSESVAYLRIQVSRRARAVPELLAAIRRGELHLTGARLLAPHLTSENARELLAAARHKTKAQIEKLLADRFPRPDRPTEIRQLPQAAPELRPAPCAAPPRPPLAARDAAPSAGPAEQAQGPSVSAPISAPPPAAERARSEPLGRARYRVSFTLDEASHEKLEELQAWLRHKIPNGDMGQILALAIDLLHEKEHRRRSAATPSPRPPGQTSDRITRHVPAHIRRAVWKRDGGRCSYRSPSGKRCGSREFLELHHDPPWERGREHRVGNIWLRCRTHNDYAARRDFGEAHMARFRRPPDEQAPRVTRSRTSYTEESRDTSGPEEAPPLV